MQPMHPGDRTYRNQTIRLTDLTVVNDVIEGMTFENCNIIGPAVIAFLPPGELRNSGFDGDEEGLLWDVGERQHIIGAIGLSGCTIVGCRFQRIGIVVRAADREFIRRGLGFPDA
jgi:hypothetical protein